MPVIELSASNREQRLNAILADYFDAIDAGQPENRPALVADHPDLAPDIEAYFAEQDGMIELASPLRAIVQPHSVEIITGILGDYRIIREVGRGGMGIVYEAEQISLDRRVALKVLPFAATMDPKQLQRFRNEAKAAASLHHEHIVPVYGVGSERGVHYYAMQFIDGVTLAAAIDELRSEKQLNHRSAEDTEKKEKTLPKSSLWSLCLCGKNSFRIFAGLIADAADALEYAHSMGIVHRDVKPGNLIVDAAGKLWVADFGLARFGPDAGLTMTGDLVGTLRYMAPEQALAKHGLADHRVDVYGLGCTLYELLTGKPAVNGKDRAEILRAIAFEEPIAPRKLARTIPAELETITLKCLAKEPKERYATAGELAADLRRWISDKPIAAKPPSFLDRAGKWARRHRAGIAAATAFLVVATAGLTTSVILLAKKEHETWQANAKAQTRLKQLEEANALLGSVFEKLDPRAEEKGGPALRDQLKAQLRRAVQDLDAEAVGDALTVARLQDTLGKSLTGLGEPGEAVDVLGKAGVVRQELLGSDHEDTLDSQNNLAIALLDSGQIAKAIKLHELVRDGRTAKLGADHLATLSTLNNLATAYQADGKLPEAIRLYERVRDARVAKLGADDPATLTTQNNLAAAYQDAGRLTDAIRLFQRVHETLLAKLGADHQSTLTAVNNLADAYQSSGDFPKAIRLYEQARDTLVTKWGPNHALTLTVLDNLARAYQDAGRLPDAIRIFEFVRSAQIEKHGADHPDTLVTLDNLARAYQAAGRLQDAISLYEQVRDASVAKLGPDHPGTLATLDHLAEAYQAVGRLPEAIRLFKAASAGRRAKLGAEHPETLTSRCNLAVALQRAGKSADAIRMLEEIRDIRIRKQGADSPDTLLTLYNLAGAYEEVGRLAEAISLLEQVRDANVAKLGADHPDTLKTLARLAQAYHAAGRASDAAPILERVRDARIAHVGMSHPDTLMVSSSLAKAYQKSGRLPEAIRLFENARDVEVTQLGAEHPETLSTLNNLATAYHDAGRLPEAVHLLEQVRDARTAKLGPNHPATLTTLNNLGSAYRASGKLADAARLFEEAASGIERLEFQHQFATRIVNNTIDCYESLNDFEKAISWRRKSLAVIKEKSGADSLEYAAGLAALGSTLARAQKFTDAESTLRESLAIRSKKMPDAWMTYNTKSMLGGALLGQRKFPDAEPQLLEGWEGMQQRAADIPAAARPRLAEAVERVIQLYEQTGRDETAKEWRTKLASMNPAKSVEPPATVPAPKP